jgi:hypothetical protein
MRRGGRRKRWISCGDAAVYCTGGRWGPRRTRVSECSFVLRSEDLYTALLRSNAAAVKPGALGTLTYHFSGRTVSASWEVRQNAVWRRGRVFLGCPRCSQRCTRLYMPLPTSWLACRRCWGLTYNSRTLQNYKDSLWGRGMFARMFGTSQRDWAYQTTDDHCESRRNASLERWAARRQWLARVPNRGNSRRTGSQFLKRTSITACRFRLS